jgi:hypothetical protein
MVDEFDMVNNRDLDSEDVITDLVMNYVWENNLKANLPHII